MKEPISYKNPGKLHLANVATSHPVPAQSPELAKALETIMSPDFGQELHPLTTGKPLAGPKPEVMLDLREQTVNCLISIAEALKYDDKQIGDDYQSSASLHIQNWLGHKGIRV